MLSPNQPAPRHKLVLDTNIVLDWLVFRDPQTAPLELLIAQQAVQLLANPATLAEWQRVLTYPKWQLSTAERTSAMQRYAACCTLFTTPATLTAIASAACLPICRDPDDQKFLALAQHSGAHALLSKDKALLQFGRQRYRTRLNFQVCTLSAWLASITPASA